MEKINTSRLLNYLGGAVIAVLITVIVTMSQSSGQLQQGDLSGFTMIEFQDQLGTIESQITVLDKEIASGIIIVDSKVGALQAENMKLKEIFSDISATLSAGGLVYKDVDLNNKINELGSGT